MDEKQSHAAEVRMNDWKPRMEKAVRHLAGQLAGIRTGTLGVGFVETFRVSFQGSTVPLGKLAAVARQGDRIVVTPFDTAAVPAVVKALTDSKLGAYALNPRAVAVTVPPVSGEQRDEMVRHVKKLGEEAKVAVRSVRQDARKQIAARGRGSERAVQEATDAAVAEIERLVKEKTRELGSCREGPQTRSPARLFNLPDDRPPGRGSVTTDRNENRNGS
jgi:ribosome recycling factor